MGNAMQDALDAMTAGTRERKADKGATLTPVTMERVLPRTRAPFPNDHPTEVVESAVRAIRREVQYILDALDAIDATNGVPPVEATVPPEEAERIRNKVADATFAEKFAQQQAEAQAAVFGSVPDQLPTVEALTASRWVCPTHGSAALARTVSRRRPDFLSCNLCDQYER